MKTREIGLFIFILVVILISACSSRFARYSDGGKLCNSSDECEGNCIIKIYDVSKAYCEYNNGTKGCYATIESYKINEYMFICAD